MKRHLITALACLLISSCCSMGNHPIDGLLKATDDVSDKPVLRVLFYPVQFVGFIALTPAVFICMWQEENR